METPKENETKEPVNPMVLDLHTPIMVMGNEVKRLTFTRRPTAGDIEWLEDSGFEGAKGSIHMLARLTLVPSASIRDMDSYDFRRADSVLAGFMKRSPKIGTQP